MIDSTTRPHSLAAMTLMLCLGMISGCATSQAPPATLSTHLELINVRKISDRAPHSAFTSLIRFKGAFYCAFREAQSHAVVPGAVRVLRSADGGVWESAALLGDGDVYDLRDPHLSITPAGELMLVAAKVIQPTDVASRRFQTVARFSEDGSTWSPPIDIGEQAYWIWSVSWHRGQGYGFGYNYANRNQLRLYHSADDGRTFDVLIDDLGDHQYPNETSIEFDESGVAHCLLRRGAPARLGIADPPYTQWRWTQLDVGIGGPALIQLPDGRWLAAGRGSKDGAKTILWWLNVETGKLTEALVLPSGGDTSYPGLVLHEGILWVSYYSSHEGKTGIYLAEVR